MKDKDIGGAVYVYINKAGLWENVSPVRLNGNKNSMFGLAVEDIGDINQDSYRGNTANFLHIILYMFCLISCTSINFFFWFCSCTDLAVGAPQEDDGAGKVFIYQGSAQGVQTIPAQVVNYIDLTVNGESVAINPLYLLQFATAQTTLMQLLELYLIGPFTKIHILSFRLKFLVTFFFVIADPFG